MTYDISQRYAVGDVVLTPLGRRARVLGEGEDGRVRLFYLDCDEKTALRDSPSLHEKLLQRLPQ